MKLYLVYYTGGSGKLVEASSSQEAREVAEMPNGCVEKLTIHGRAARVVAAFLRVS